ncbi:hypothetical protein Tco_0957685 [Tanacetum coccineum]
MLGQKDYGVTWSVRLRRNDDSLQGLKLRKSYTVLTARGGICGLHDSFFVLYRLMKKLLVMVDVARRSRLGAWLRA